MAGSPRSSFLDDDDEDERTVIDPSPPAALQARWEERTALERAENLRSPQGKSGINRAQPDFDEQSEVSTMDEYTLEESKRGRGRLKGAAMGSFQVKAGNDRGKTFELSGKRATLGRGVDNELVLSDLAVSRQHLVVDFNGQYYTISDLGSGNGTLINDEEYEGEIRLYDGDRLELGNTILEVALPNHGRRPEPQEQNSHLAPVPDDEDDMSTLGARGAPILPSPAQALAAVRNRGGPPQGLPSAPPGASVSPNVLAQKPTAPLSAQRRLPTNDFLPGAPDEFANPPSTLDGAPSPVAQAAKPQWSKDADRLPVRGATPRNPTAPVVYGNQAAGAAHRQVQGQAAQVKRLPIGQMAARAKAGISNDPKKLAFAAGGVVALVALIAVVFAVSSGGSKSDETEAAANQLVEKEELGESGAKAALDEGDDKNSDDKKETLTNSDKGDDKNSDDKKEALANSDKGDDKNSDDKKEALANSDKGDDKNSDDKKENPVVGKAPKQEKKPVADAIPLPRTTWGTDESVLLASLKLPATETIEPEEDPVEPDPPEEDTRPPEEPVKETVKPTRDRVVRDKPSRAERERAAAARRERAERAADIRRERAERAAEKRRERAERLREERAKRTATKAAGNTGAAKSKAAALYKSRDFGAAASLLKAAAAKAGSSEARKLRRLAGAYQSVGANLSKGSGDPVSAAKALSKALSADRKAGKAHQSLIKAKLKIYAPKAAKSMLARKDWPGAKRMADVASSIGAKSQVGAVRAKLEKTAGQIYSTAAKAARGGNKTKARKLLKQIRSMVPSSSSWYKKAGSALSKLS